MRLSSISESPEPQPAPEMHTFYKGMSASNFEKFKKHRIPGFLADYHMARIYADPTTQGHTEPVVMIGVEVDINRVEDERCRPGYKGVGDMCGGWQNPKSTRHDELRQKIWWSNSVGHGMRGIYYGQPVDDYEVIYVANDQEESDQYDIKHPYGIKKGIYTASAGTRIPQMKVPYEKHYDQAMNDPDEGSTLTWRDYL